NRKGAGKIHGRKGSDWNFCLLAGYQMAVNFIRGSFSKIRRKKGEREGKKRKKREKTEKETKRSGK
ncbi:MAG: hypothetical protein WC183_10265, partial [Methanosarcina sp.]